MNSTTHRRSSQRRAAVNFWIATAVLVCCPTDAYADLTVVEQPQDSGTLTIYRLNVTPAPEPDPPLRHRLAVREIDLQPGNAATQYLRAFPESGFERNLKQLIDEHGEEFYDWGRPAAMPLGQVPLEKAREAASSFDSVVDNFIAPATIRRDCDWGLEIEQMRGPQIVQVLLPEFQASRSISRALALRARVAIAEGDYERAIEQLRMNYRLAQNVGGEPLLICGLIGLAEASIGNEQIVEMIGARGSPNLFWALAELPRPFVDIRRAVRFEMSLGLRVFPFLIDPETARHSPEEWARLLTNAYSEAGELTASGSTLGSASSELKQAAVAGLSLIVYPGAKQRLIEGGMTAARVDAMPVGQVIAVDAAREYRRVADQLEKRMYFPYHIARHQKRQQPFDVHGAMAVTRGYGYMLASLLLPAVEAARTAEMRIEWQMRAMQVVEAIRMHADATGSLPASLEEIDLVPVPINPVTNEPYEYRLESGTAVVELPFSDGFPGIARRFEIRLQDVDRSP